MDSTSAGVAYEVSTGDTYSKHDWARDQAREARRAAKKRLNDAAPDMLAALKAGVPIFDPADETVWAVDDLYAELVRVKALFVAAIEKAEGTEVE